MANLMQILMMQKDGVFFCSSHPGVRRTASPAPGLFFIGAECDDEPTHVGGCSSGCEVLRSAILDMNQCNPYLKDTFRIFMKLYKQVFPSALLRPIVVKSGNKSTYWSGAVFPLLGTCHLFPIINPH